MDLALSNPRSTNKCQSRQSFCLLQAVLCVLLTCSPAEAIVESNLVERPKKELLHIVDIGDLSRSDREIAEQLEIWSMLNELFGKTKVPDANRKTELRRKIRETILESYFDAVSVQAEAQREESLLEALKQTVISKRDRNVELNNAGNFILSGTLNTVGSVLGFSNSIPPFSGNLNQMLSGVVSTSMSTYALKQSNGGKTKGHGHPTVIAELFGRPCDERTTYPESVWRFLHGTSLDDPSKTRAQVLEEEWILRHYLEPHGSKRESLKLDLVCGAVDSRKSMTIDDLNDQIKMINDISSVAARMTHHLRDLLSLTDSDI